MTYWYEQYKASGDIIHFSSFYGRAHWETVFVILPKRCNLTGKRLWLQWAERGTAIWTGPGDPVVEHKYHHPRYHLLWLITYEHTKF